MRLLRFALIVHSILLVGVSQAASPPLTNPQQEEKTSSPKTSGAGEVAAKPQADGVAQATSEKPVTKTKVEVRKSSDSARAKGDINFDDLSFKIEKGRQIQTNVVDGRYQEARWREGQIAGLHPAQYLVQGNQYRSVRAGQGQSGMLFWPRCSSLRLCDC